MKTSISNLIKLYTKRASLRSEMADRIMFSTIPHFDSEKIYSPDIPALEKAVNGAKKLILFGTYACLDELCHYEGNRLSLPMKSTTPDIVDKNTIKMFISILIKTKKAFNDLKNWAEMFGGKKWAVICESILKLAIEYEKYLNEKDYNKKIEFGKMVIVYMNALDGLAHNTGSLYSKLLNEECIQNDDDFSNFNNEYLNINRLMNAKELINPSDVVEEVKNDLELPLAYKDYLTKARQQKLQNPNSVMDSNDRNGFLRSITLKKKAKFDLEEKLFTIEEIISTVNGIDDKFSSQLLRIASNLKGIISSITTILTKFSQFASLKYNRSEFINQQIANLTKIQSDIDNINNKEKLLVQLNILYNWIRNVKENL